MAINLRSSSGFELGPAGLILANSVLLICSFWQELEVCTALTLNNHRDYMHGDNNDVIATDSQKNTVHVLAKQFGVSIAVFSVINKQFLDLHPWKCVCIDCVVKYIVIIQ